VPPSDRQDQRQDHYSALSPTLSSLVDYNALASTDRTNTRSNSANTRHVVVLSAGPTLRQDDNSLTGRTYTCLSYSERDDGVLVAQVGSCSGHQAQPDQNLRGVRDYYSQKQVSAKPTLRFNITSSGPCLQALTGSSVKTSISPVVLAGATMLTLVMVAR
jgi:hypothetical protein